MPASCRRNSRGDRAMKLPTGAVPPTGTAVPLGWGQARTVLRERSPATAQVSLTDGEHCRLGCSGRRDLPPSPSASAGHTRQGLVRCLPDNFAILWKDHPPAFDPAIAGRAAGGHRQGASIEAIGRRRPRSGGDGAGDDAVVAVGIGSEATDTRRHVAFHPAWVTAHARRPR